MRTDSTNPRKLTAAERRTIVVEMRKDGYTVREIAKHLGVSHNAVHKAEMKALAELANREADGTKSMRALQVQRLEAQHKRLTKIANDPDTPLVAKLNAEATLLKLDERISKKYGTDAPIVIESTSKVAHDLTPDQMSRVAQLVKAQNTDGNQGSTPVEGE